MVVINGVLGNWFIINKRIFYKKVLLSKGVRPKDLLSHYEFRKKVALYWINFELYEQDYDILSSPPSSTTTTAGTSSRRPKRKLEFSLPQSAISSLTT